MGDHTERCKDFGAYKSRLQLCGVVGFFVSFFIVMNVYETKLEAYLLFFAWVIGNVVAWYKIDDMIAVKAIELRVRND